MLYFHVALTAKLCWKSGPVITRYIYAVCPAMLACDQCMCKERKVFWLFVACPHILCNASLIVRCDHPCSNVLQKHLFGKISKCTLPVKEAFLFPVMTGLINFRRYVIDGCSNGYTHAVKWKSLTLRAVEKSGSSCCAMAVF